MGIARRMLGVQSDMIHEFQDPLSALLFCLI